MEIAKRVFLKVVYDWLVSYVQQTQKKVSATWNRSQGYQGRPDARAVDTTKELFQTSFAGSPFIYSTSSLELIYKPLKEFINGAANAARIARGKKNGKELKFFAQKVGSNYLLEKKRVAYSPNYPYISLAARPTEACNHASTLEMCQRQDLNLHELMLTRL